MQALVTGANGFIGKILCEYLHEQGHQVHAITRDVISDINGCTNWDDYLSNIDVVFHLANIVHADNGQIPDSRYWEINVRGTENLAKYAVKNGVKSLVYFSSVFAEMNNVYGRSKKLAENILLSPEFLRKMHVCVLRPSLVYGPKVKGNLNKMIRAIAKGWFPPIPDNGNVKPMVSVYDVALAAIKVACANKSHGKIYTLVDDGQYSSRDIYDQMRAALGLSKRTWYIPLIVLRMLAWAFKVNSINKLLESSALNSKSIKQDLGWQAKYNLVDVLPDMVAEYKK